MMNPLAPGANVAQRPNAMMPGAQPVAQAPKPQFAYPADYIKSLGLSPAALLKEIKTADYAAKEFGTLARNPDVTHKDVINSAGQAVADGMLSPTEAVQMLSTVPQDPAKLKMWLDASYGHQMMAAVHLKALAMGAAPAQAPAAMAAMAPGAAPGGPNPNAAPMPGNAPEPVTTGA